MIQLVSFFHYKFELDWEFFAIVEEETLGKREHSGKGN